MKKFIESEALKDIDRAIGGRKLKGKPALISEKQKAVLDKNKI